MNFDAVATAGDLTVSTMTKDKLPGGAGIGFQLVTPGKNTIYDIATSVSGWGTLTVTLPYDPSISNTQAAKIEVWHWSGGPGWDKLSGTVDTTAKTITFTTTSLSPFALVLPETPPQPVVSTPASSAFTLWVLAILGLAIGGKRRNRASA